MCPLRLCSVSVSQWKSSNFTIISIFFYCSLLISAVLICFGMTFIILACAIPQPKLFYPFFVFIFYLLSIIPVIIARRVTPNNDTNPRSEFALFLAAGFVLSAFALPIVLARVGTVSPQERGSHLCFLIVFVSSLDYLASVLAYLWRKCYKLLNDAGLCYEGWRIRCVRRNVLKRGGFISNFNLKIIITH